jgi:2-oxoglutarate dehydrogenase E1 component
VSELSEGGFLDLIWDDWCKEQNGGDGSKVRKVLFCSGKVYYDLLARQREGNHTDVAIIRLEQLYPLALREITEVLELYPNAETCWVQEEPANMGAWNYILGRTYALDMISDMKWTLIARKSSASPATGFKKVHDQEQEDIVNRAFS